jgi:hypothetical protein
LSELAALRLIENGRKRCCYLFPCGSRMRADVETLRVAVAKSGHVFDAAPERYSSTAQHTTRWLPAEPVGRGGEGPRGHFSIAAWWPQSDEHGSGAIMTSSNEGVRVATWQLSCDPVFKACTWACEAGTKPADVLAADQQRRARSPSCAEDTEQGQLREVASLFQRALAVIIRAGRVTQHRPLGRYLGGERVRPTETTQSSQSGAIAHCCGGWRDGSTLP